jgi:hypothetical protein
MTPPTTNGDRPDGVQLCLRVPPDRTEVGAPEGKPYEVGSDRAVQTNVRKLVQNNSK